LHLLAFQLIDTDSILFIAAVGGNTSNDASHNGLNNLTGLSSFANSVSLSPDAKKPDTTALSQSSNSFSEAHVGLSSAGVQCHLLTFLLTFSVEVQSCGEW